MERIIYKYHLPLLESYELEMPQHGQILSLQEQNGLPTLYVMVDKSDPIIKQTFYIVGTGNVFDLRDRLFVGTVQISDYVWHIFRQA